MIQANRPIAHLLNGFTPHLEVSLVETQLQEEAMADVNAVDPHGNGAKGDSEDSNHNKDVIPSDEGQLETLSPNLPSSNGDDLKQEELQVGNKQQTVSTLDQNNQDSPSETTVSTKDAASPLAIAYGPESITAKFNALVSASKNTPANTSEHASANTSKNISSSPASNETNQNGAEQKESEIAKLSATPEPPVRSTIAEIAEPPVTPKPPVGSTIEEKNESPSDQTLDLESEAKSEAVSALSNGDLSEAGPDLDKIDLDAFIRYPEALILIFFTIAFFIWQIYIAILDDAAPDGQLTANKLAKRLGVNRSTISRRKEKPGFDEWAQSIDPDGLAWRYSNGFFVPYISEGSPN